MSGSMAGSDGEKRLLAPLVILAALIMLIDGADMTALPLTVPYIARDWNASPATFGVALSAMPMGFGVGALLVGPLGDRYGRRPLIIGSILAVALATIGTAFSANAWHFVLLRLLTGAGLGAALVNLNALMAERAPLRVRARLLTIISCGIPVGAAVAGFLVPPAVAVAGWQGVFTMLGVGILLLTLALFRWLPEAPAAGATGEARVVAEKAKGFSSLLLPLSRNYWLITFVFVGLYTMNALSLYMLSAWLPTVLSQANFTPDDAARLAGVMQIGGLIGGITLSYCVDRKMTVPALVTSYLMVAAVLFAFGVVPTGLFGWGALLLLVGGGISGAHMTIMALGTFFYPPKVLASALGLAVAVARIGAVVGPLAGGLMVQAKVGAPGFMLALLPPIAFCILCVALIPRVERKRAALA